MAFENKAPRFEIRFPDMKMFELLFSSKSEIDSCRFLSTNKVPKTVTNFGILSYVVKLYFTFRQIFDIFNICDIYV